LESQRLARIFVDDRTEYVGGGGGDDEKTAFC